MKKRGRYNEVKAKDLAKGMEEQPKVVLEQRILVNPELPNSKQQQVATQFQSFL